MDRVLIKIGNVEIAWYSVLIAVGAIIGIAMVMKEGKRFGFKKDFLFNTIFWAIIFGIIGARLYYVLFNLDYYKNFVDVLKIWEGGLAIHGGIIAGIITIIIYCKKYKVNPMKIFDYAAPALLLAQAIGRWGNFFNGEAHGGITTLEHLQNMHLPEFIINGMNIDGNYYIPTFLYESIWCLLGVILILIIRRLKYVKVSQIFGTYLVWYSAGRFIIEGMRTDSLMLGGFRVAQIVSILMFISGFLIIFLANRKDKFENLYNEQENGEIMF